MLTVRIFYPTTTRNLFDSQFLVRWYLVANFYLQLWRKLWVLEGMHRAWKKVLSRWEEGVRVQLCHVKRHAFLSNQLLSSEHFSSTFLIFLLENPDISQYSTCWSRLSWYVDQSSIDRQPTYRSPWSKRFFLKVFSMCGEEWYYNNYYHLTHLMHVIYGNGSLQRKSRQKTHWNQNYSERLLQDL